MIAFLRGIVLQKTAAFVILDRHDLGYKIFVTPEALERATVGELLELYTYLKASDDGQTLFGLPDFLSLQFFELLLTVSGVGPKVALSILSAAKPSALKQAIVNQDSAIFTRMSGVGKKTAERIILELKNKVVGGGLPDASNSSSDLYDALINLGYNPREVRDIIPKINTLASMEAQLKEALGFLAKK